MTDEFMREVDEELRDEYLRKLWSRFGPYVIAVALLIIVVTAGYKGWEYYTKSQAEASGDKLVNALQLMGKGEKDQSIGLLQELADSGSGGYPVLAKFRLAAQKAVDGDIDAAIEDYKSLASSDELDASERYLAALRMNLLLLEKKTAPADLETEMTELLAESNPFRHMAREIVGLSYYEAGDKETAGEWFQKAIQDSNLTENIRQRLGQYLELLKSQGVKVAKVEIKTESTPVSKATQDNAEPLSQSEDPSSSASQIDHDATGSVNTTEQGEAD